MDMLGHSLTWDRTQLLTNLPREITADMAFIRPIKTLLIPLFRAGRVLVTSVNITAILGISR